MEKPTGNGMRPPEEILATCCAGGAKKAGTQPARTWWTAMGAGACIALAAFGSLQVGLADAGKVFAGAVFATGLIAVVVLGLQLFTGNILIAASAWNGQNAWPAVLKNWGMVYLGNLAGAVLVAALIRGANPSAAWQQALADLVRAKLGLTWLQALTRGILCNVLVSGAVMLSYASASAGGKVPLIVFPITLFIVSGYEHVVANFFYFAAGAMFGAGGMNGLAMGKNLALVTAGNIGGGLLVSALMMAAGRGGGKG